MTTPATTIDPTFPIIRCACDQADGKFQVLTTAQVQAVDDDGTPQVDDQGQPVLTTTSVYDADSTEAAYHGSSHYPTCPNLPAPPPAPAPVEPTVAQQVVDANGVVLGVTIGGKFYPVGSA